jgi:hypothetical protein
MRILTQQTQDLTINGLMSAFSVAKHECLFTTGNKCVFDAFHEFKPDIYINIGEATNEIVEAIRVFQCKLVTIGPSCLYNPKPAANIAQLLATKRNKTSKLSYIMLEPMNENTMGYLENFMYPNHEQNLYLKTFGTKIPYPCYIAPISSMRDIAEILAESTFYLDYLNNLVLDAWMNNTVCIPYRSNPILFPEEIFGRYDEPNQLWDIIKQYNDDFRIEKIKTAQSWIIGKNTYFDRVIELLQIIKMDKEVEECSNIFSEIKKSLKLG